MLGLLDLRTKVLGGALIVLLLGCATLGFQLVGAQNRVAELQRDAATLEAARERTARETTERYRQIEQAMQAKVKEIEDAHRTENSRNRAAAHALRVDRDRLRNELATFARGADPAGDTVAACGDRAATLGDVLGDALRVQEDLAGAAEAHAADVRALLAWGKALSCQ